MVKKEPNGIKSSAETINKRLHRENTLSTNKYREGTHI